MKLFKACFVNLVLILLLSAPALAQGPSDPGDPGCDPLDPYCPIDGGLSLLIAAAIGVGAKKAYHAKNKTKTSSY